MKAFSLLLALVTLTPTLYAQKEFGFDNRKSSGQPYLTPEETVKKMKVAPEFEVKLFAGEPQCVNPIAMTIDEKGRVWIVECFEYPSKTPPGKAPRDRIVILEDTDGDGKCDKRTVFAEGKDFPVSDERKKAGLGAFDMASGIEVGNGGVYLGAPPYLWFIENKDDKPGKFERVLSGFGSQDTHETLNTFQWGPDGWLYGLHGVFTHSVVKPLDGPETRMNAAVWRFHPKTKKFEIYAEGTSNPWGIDYRNSDGQWILACCVIPHLYHIVPGGIYKRQGGQSFNQYAYGQINEISDHTFHKESGWAHAGLISLDTPHIPEKYRNRVIFGSIHGCSIKQNILKPNGSSYIASKGEDFLVSGDKNFRPINMRWGPHGDIYLIDWHDQNPCHQAAKESWDYERGRVYRIEVKGRKGGKAEDLEKLKLAELDPYLQKSPYYARTALRLITEAAINRKSQLDNDTTRLIRNNASRSDLLIEKAELAKKNIYTILSTHRIYEGYDLLIDEVELLEKDSNRLTPRPRVGPSLSEFGHMTHDNWVFDKFIEYRSLMIRDWTRNVSFLNRDILDRIEKDNTPIVRRELASAIIKIPELEQTSNASRALMKRCANDVNDPQIPLLLWLGYERVIADRKLAERELPWLAEQAPKNALIREYIVPRVMRRLMAANEIALGVGFLNLVKDAASREKALDGLVIALDQRTLDAPESWEKLRPELLAMNNAKITAQVNRLSVSFRDPAAIKRAMEIANNKTAEIPARLEAIRQLATLKVDNGGEIMYTLMTTEKSEAIVIEAVRGLAAFDYPKAPAMLIGVWKHFPPAVRAELVNTLASRKQWAKELLQALADKKIDARDLTDNTIIRMQAFKDKDIAALIEKAWGRTRPTPDELLKLIDKTRDALDETPASYVRGKEVFKTQCAKCHKFNGEGVEVGPPLDGAARDIEYILANVIDPNRVIGAPYFLRTATMLDGQIFQGLLVEEDAQTITLKVENAVQKKLLKKDIDGAVKVTEKSMMPEGLTAGMTPQNFRDVIRYAMAHPFVTEVMTKRHPSITAGVTGKLKIPKSDDKELIVQFTLETTDTLKTKLLIGNAYDVSVRVNGKDVGSAKATGRDNVPDAASVDVDLPKGKHNFTIVLDPKAGDKNLYLRFLDPDRKIVWK